MFIGLVLCLVLAAILWLAATRGCLGAALSVILTLVAVGLLVATLFTGGRDSPAYRTQFYAPYNVR